MSQVSLRRATSKKEAGWGLPVGVASLPTFLVRPHVAAGALVSLLDGRAVGSGLVQVLSRHPQGMPLRVRRFIDRVVAQAPDLA